MDPTQEKTMDGIDIEVEVHSKPTHDLVTIEIENYNTTQVAVRLTQPLPEHISESQIATLSEYHADSWTVSAESAVFVRDIDWGSSVETGYAIKDIEQDTLREILREISIEARDPNGTEVASVTAVEPSFDDDTFGGGGSRGDGEQDTDTTDEDVSPPDREEATDDRVDEPEPRDTSHHNADDEGDHDADSGEVGDATDGDTTETGPDASRHQSTEAASVGTDDSDSGETTDTETDPTTGPDEEPTGRIEASRDIVEANSQTDRSSLDGGVASDPGEQTERTPQNTVIQWDDNDDNGTPGDEKDAGGPKRAEDETAETNPSDQSGTDHSQGHDENDSSLPASISDYVLQDIGDDIQPEEFAWTTLDTRDQTSGGKSGSSGGFVSRLLSWF